jgi:hypothetical protein
MLSIRASAASPNVVRDCWVLRAARGSRPSKTIWRALAAFSRAFCKGTSWSGPNPISRRRPATFHMNTHDAAPLGLMLR